MELDVRNNYFRNGICSSFYIIPFNSTGKKLKNYNILMDRKSNIFSFYIGMENQEIFSIEKDCSGINDLYFQLISSDPAFANYTDLPVSNKQQIFYLENSNTSTSLLHKDPFVSQKEILAIKPKIFNFQLQDGVKVLEVKTREGKIIESQSFEGNMQKSCLINLIHQVDGVYEIWVNDQLRETFFSSGEELAENCIAVIHLSIENLIENYQDGMTYNIVYNARSVFWQYQVVIPESRKIEVLDLSVDGISEENYEGPEKEVIIGNQTAQVFTSSIPVQLQYQLEANPLLHVTYSNDFSSRRNQLEIKLPNPEVAELKMYNQGKNEGSFFSSTIIYV